MKSDETCAVDGINLFEYLDELISKARACTEQDILNRFIEYGFTQEDYKKLKKLKTIK